METPMSDSRGFSVEPLEAGRSRLSYRPTESSQKPQEWITAYPQDLIQLILDIRGSASAIDEIRREEDPRYVQACLEVDIAGYVDPHLLIGKRWLDFGCGGGASTMILARMFPESPIIGLDLSDRSLKIAQARCIHYRYRTVEFRRSPSPDRLPEDIGTFDAILLSAVLEHLLPDERRTLLPGLWGLLNPGGVLFIDQTPWRFFPFEGHTTRLPLLNYLPDRMALAYARTFSRRVDSGESWQTLLRRGIRGASVREIRRNLLSRCGSDFEFLTPNRLGLRDRVDLWYAGYAVSISNKYGWARPIQEFLRWAFKAVYWITGAAIVPSLSLALCKESASSKDRGTDIL